MQKNKKKANVNFSETIARKLSFLQKHSKNNNMNKVNACTKYLISNPEFWICCYKSIENDFNTKFFKSLVSSKKKILMNFVNLNFFYKLSISILKGNFKDSLTFLISPSLKSKKSFPFFIGINSKNKIVQKGIIVIIKELSEYRFLDCSFGLRKKKSRYDAIKYIKKNVSSSIWIIKDNIRMCFNHSNRKKFISLIRKKYISQPIFVNFLCKVLKFFSISSSFANKVKNLKKSLISLTFFNIYFHELDVFVHEKKVKSWRFFEDQKLFKTTNIYKITNEKKKHKIIYVRHVNNFIVFIRGTLSFCLKLIKGIEIFVKNILNLILCSKKLSITFFKKKTDFLGFQIQQCFCKFDTNFYKKTNKNAVVQIPRIKITFSLHNVLRKLVNKNFVCYKAGNFFPTSCKLLLQYNVSDIVHYNSAVFRNLINYYNFAQNWYDTKIIYNYFGRFSTAMTIAQKTKSKITSVFKKYGLKLVIRNIHNKIVTSFGILSNSIFKKRN